MLQEFRVITIADVDLLVVIAGFRDEGRGIRVIQWLLQGVCEINGQEARWQVSFFYIEVGFAGSIALGWCARAGYFFLADFRKTVVGNHDDICVAVKIVGFQIINNLPQIVVSVTNRGSRRWAVNSRIQLIEAVSLIVLRAIWITRPENKEERFQLFLESR